MGYPLKEDFVKGPITQVSSSWFNTVARILNHAIGANITITKTAEPTASAPWIWANTPPEEGGEYLPPHWAETENHSLTSTGESVPTWQDIREVIVALLGAVIGNARQVLQISDDGTSVSLGVAMPDSTTLADGDVIYYDGSALIRLPKGSNDQVLTLTAGVPAWEDSSGGDVTVPDPATGDDYDVLQVQGGVYVLDNVRAT